MDSNSRQNNRDEQAARWAARVAHGRIDGLAYARLQAWLDDDRRNRGAYLRAQAALHTIEQAVLDQSGKAPVSGAQSARRARQAAPGWIRGFAVAASLAVATWVGAGWWNHDASGQQVMALQDGSRIRLVGDADVRVEIDAHVRRISLIRGTATFEVAKDGSRPFVVEAGRVFAQATGTVYTVSRVGSTGAQVDVAEGGVLVWAGQAREHAVQLRAGGSMTLDPGDAPDERQMSFDGVSIAEAVARFNAINGKQIAIADQAIGEVEIVGVFKRDDPERFARAVALLTGARISEHGQVILLETP